MKPELLRAAGEALYGPRWQSELAGALGIADRTMRRWVAGEFEIPEGVAGEIRDLLDQRGKTISALLKRLAAKA